MPSLPAKVPLLWALGNRALWRRALCGTKEECCSQIFLPALQKRVFSGISILTYLIIARPHVCNPIGVVLIKWPWRPQVSLKCFLVHQVRWPVAVWEFTVVSMAVVLRNGAVTVSVWVWVCVRPQSSSGTHLLVIIELWFNWCQAVQDDQKQ